MTGDQSVDIVVTGITYNEAQDSIWFAVDWNQNGLEEVYVLEEPGPDRPALLASKTFWARCETEAARLQEVGLANKLIDAVRVLHRVGQEHATQERALRKRTGWD